VAKEKGETSHSDNKKRKATFAGDESAKRLFKMRLLIYTTTNTHSANT